MQPGSSPIAESLWAELRRRRRPATIRELQLATATRRSSVVQQIGRWERAGFVRRIPDTRPLAIAMIPTVVKYPKPPRAVCSDRPGAHQRQRIWAAMRILKRFDIPALEIASQASRRGVETYLNVLLRAGYAKRLSRGHHKLGTWSTYQLVRDTGRKSPAVSNRAGACRLVDRNDGSSHVLTAAVAPSEGGEY